MSGYHIALFIEDGVAVAWHDASGAGFSTDGSHRQLFESAAEAEEVAAVMRARFPNARAIAVEPASPAEINPTATAPWGLAEQLHDAYSAARRDLTGFDTMAWQEIGASRRQLWRPMAERLIEAGVCAGAER